MLVYKTLYTLMGGGGGGLGGQIPFSDSSVPRTLMSVLDAENSKGRGVLGFLTAEEQRKLRLNNELNSVIQEFPLGRESEVVQSVPDRILVSWRRIHANAKNIKIQGNITDDQLIAFLTVPDNRGIVHTIDNLDISGQEQLTDAIVPYLKGLKYLDISGCINLGLDAFKNLDISRLETFIESNTLVLSSDIQRMVNLKELVLRNFVGDADFSMLPELKIFSGSHIQVPKLPKSVVTLVLSDIVTLFDKPRNDTEKKLQALLDSLPNCEGISLTQLSYPVNASLKFNSSIKELSLWEIQDGAIDDDSFQNCQLDSLSLDGQFRITQKTFSYMKNLQKLAVFCNERDNLGYKGDVFMSLPNLRILFVDNHSLRKLNPIKFASGSAVTLDYIS